MAIKGDPKLAIWSMLLLVGGVVFFGAFFSPWWSLTQTQPAQSDMPKYPTMTRFEKAARDEHQKQLKEYREKMKEWTEKRREVTKVLDSKKSWYLSKVSTEKLQAMGERLQKARKEDQEGAVSASIRLWGWNVGVALTAFIFSFVLMAVAIVPMGVRLLRGWIWPGYFAAAVMGLIALILALVWYFGAPGKDVPGQLTQGVGWYPGPYMVIAGSVIVLAAGVLGGVFGLLNMLRQMKTGRRDVAYDEFA